MLDLQQVPAMAQGDLKWGTGPLSVTPLGTATTLAEAWAFLPNQGEGVLVCADSIRRFSPAEREGLLLDADVVTGSETVVVRSSGPEWKAWKWAEQGEEEHRYVEFSFLSSEPGDKPARSRYRQYWRRQDENGIKVWQPIGARFCGFEEDGK